MSLQKTLTVARMASARGLIAPMKNSVAVPQRNFLIRTLPRDKTSKKTLLGICVVFSFSVTIIPFYISLHLKEYGR